MTSPRGTPPSAECPASVPKLAIYFYVDFIQCSEHERQDGIQVIHGCILIRKSEKLKLDASQRESLERHASIDHLDPVLIREILLLQTTGEDQAWMDFSSLVYRDLKAWVRRKGHADDWDVEPVLHASQEVRVAWMERMRRSMSSKVCSACSKSKGDRRVRESQDRFTPEGPSPIDGKCI